MKVNPISAGIVFKGNPNKKQSKFNRYSLIPATGYASIGFGVASGILGHNKKIKPHRITAMVALAAAAAHVVLLKTMHLFKKPKITMA